MIRKLVVSALGVLLLGGLVLKTSVGSYVSTAYRRTANSVTETVPMEFQIDRARNMVRDLEPEIRRAMHVIAKEEVEVAALDERIGAADEKAGKDKDEILQLQSDLATGDRVFHYAGHRYTANQVKEDLARRFHRFKTADTTMTSLRQMRDARARNLDAARQQLTALVGEQKQLQVEVENLEAKLKLVQVAEASNDIQFDDSQLAHCKELITDIRTKLDVAAKLASADTTFEGEIHVGEPQAEDVTEQVAEYFGLEAVGETEVQTASYSK
jgi:predicted  nucleic acid-binding Zn-ribbon protein